MATNGLVKTVTEPFAPKARLSAPSLASKAQDDYSTIKISKADEQLAGARMLNIINKDNGREVIEDMETIVARDVEQGKCAPFKRVEGTNEKRSINEPKHTPVSELVGCDTVRRQPKVALTKLANSFKLSISRCSNLGRSTWIRQGSSPTSIQN